MNYLNEIDWHFLKNFLYNGIDNEFSDYEYNYEEFINKKEKIIVTNEKCYDQKRQKIIDEIIEEQKEKGYILNMFNRNYIKNNGYRLIFSFITTNL